MRYKFREYDFERGHVSCKDFSMLRVAAKQAASSNHHKFKLGAVLVRGGRVLSSGVNIAKKGPDTPPCRESIHAEVMAIKGAKKTEGATIYVARLSNAGRLALAKPCEYCIEHMNANGIYRVVFSISDSVAESFYLDSVEWKGFLTKEAGLNIPYIENEEG